MLEGVYQFSPDGKVHGGQSGLRETAGLLERRGSVRTARGRLAVLGSGRARRASCRNWSGSARCTPPRPLLRRRDGSQLVVLESARVVRDEQQQVLAYEGTIADITERKRVEQAIFEEKERAQVTLQSIGDGVITTDREGRIEYLNPVAEQLSGWSGAEARGATIMEVLRLRDELTNAEIENPLLRCLREDKVVQFRRAQRAASTGSARKLRSRTRRRRSAIAAAAPWARSWCSAMSPRSGASSTRCRSRRATTR